MSFDDEFEQSLEALRKEFREGRATLAEATLLDPASLEAAYATGLKMLQMNKDEAAVSMFSVLTVLDCFDVRYWRGLGLGLYKTQRARLACTVLEAALALDEDDVASHCYRAESLIAAKRLQEAHQECEWVIAHGKARSDAPFAARAKALLRYTKA